MEYNSAPVSFFGGGFAVASVFTPLAVGLADCGPAQATNRLDTAQKAAATAARQSQDRGRNFTGWEHFMVILVLRLFIARLYLMAPYQAW